MSVETTEPRYIREIKILLDDGNEPPVDVDDGDDGDHHNNPYDGHFKRFVIACGAYAVMLTLDHVYKEVTHSSAPTFIRAVSYMMPMYYIIAGTPKVSDIRNLYRTAVELGRSNLDRLCRRSE